MIARLFLALVVLASVFAASIPGVPLILEVPLNRTAFPNGLIANTTKAPSYGEVPVDQYAIFIPLNALSVRIGLTIPADPNNGYIDYDVSTNGPLCQYRFQLDSDGYLCGGIAEELFFRTGNSYNLTLTPVSYLDSPTGFLWKVGTYLYFGFTADSADSSTADYGINYQIDSIDITTCPDGTIGGENNDQEAACLPITQISSNNTANVRYQGEATYLQLNVPANVGLMEVTLTIPTAELSDTVDAKFYGAPLGAPGPFECESSGVNEATVGTNTVITWPCYAPSSGRYYIWLGADVPFNASVSVAFTTCTGNTAGANCSESLIDLGNVPAANTDVKYNYTIATGSMTQFRFNIPTGTAYPMNITFSANGSAQIAFKANSYAGSSPSAYGNSNYRDSISEGSPATFVFQAQGNVMGQVAYFYVQNTAGDDTVLNIALSTSASVIPTGTTSSNTGSNTGSSSSRSSSSGSSRSGSSNSGSSQSGSSNSMTGSTSATRTTTSSDSDASILMATGITAILALLF